MLDGGIVLLDGSAGVEAQTLTVWRQARRNNLSTVAFINKMDKPKADLSMSVESIKTKLQVEPLLIQLPIRSDQKHLQGLIDLVNMKKIIWDLQTDPAGRLFSVMDLADNDDALPEALESREALVEKLCEHDQSLADELLQLEDYQKIPAEALKQSLRKVTIGESDALVTLCGSAFKNIGVQPLMDAVNHYLPAPSDMQFPFLRYYGSHFCGLAFKTIHHQHKGKA